jgi:hypothetical protein
MLVQPQARQTSPQQAGERRLAGFKCRPPQVLAVEFQANSSTCRPSGLRRSSSNTASPLSSQATASPSIRHERTLSLRARFCPLQPSETGGRNGASVARSKGARQWLARVRRANPMLFSHWRFFNVGSGTSGAVSRGVRGYSRPRLGTRRMQTPSTPSFAAAEKIGLRAIVWMMRPNVFAFADGLSARDPCGAWFREIAGARAPRPHFEC